MTTKPKPVVDAFDLASIRSTSLKRRRLLNKPNPLLPSLRRSAPPA
jgi:hypothetical protein